MTAPAGCPAVPLRAYLVEDNVLVRENLAAALEEMVPLRVVGSTDDERAARRWLAGGETCDLVIVDLFLRSGSGLGVLAEAHRARPDTTVVVLSNYATPGIRARCVQAGAQQVFDKSRDIDQLVSFCIALAREGAPASVPVH